MAKYRNVMKLSAQRKVKFKQGVAEQKKWAVYEDVDGGGDLGLSQEKEVGNLSEICISQKKRLEVKLETAVNSVSEKNSRAWGFFCFGVAKETQPSLWGQRNGNVVKYGLLKDRKNYSMFKTILWLSRSYFIPLV